MEISRSEKAVAQPRLRRNARDLAWVSQVTLLAVFLGVLVALALSTQSQLRARGLSPSRYGTSAALAYNLSQRNEELQQANRRLQAQLAEYQAQLAKGSNASAALHKSLRDARFLAGLTAVKGRGLVITLRDSPKKAPPDIDPLRLLIHDDDLIYFLNELKAAGAEAIAVAGADMAEPQRIVTRSAVRCVGPTILVNDIPLAGPYYIYAIGNPKNLRAALEMPDGIIKGSGLDVLGMVQIEERAEIMIPAYAGKLEPREAQPVDEAS